MGTHGAVAALLSPDPSAVDADTTAGHHIRQRIHEYYQQHDGENKDLGIEMGFYYESPVVIADSTAPPKWDARYYTPTTFPGARAPHVFLKDGTAIFDLYGNDYTLIDFLEGQETGAQFLVTAAQAGLLPMKHVLLSGEEHAAKIWEKGLVLVRPDGHVAWRGDSVPDFLTATEILGRVVGMQRVAGGREGVAFNISGDGQMSTQTKTFELEKAGEFQE
jgi:FAD-dependent monooxygenase